MGFGNGTFKQMVLYSCGWYPTCVLARDVNGDNIPDLAVANNSSSDLSIILGIGDGTFASQVFYVAGNSPSSVALEDLNGDGFLDAAIGNNSFPGGITMMFSQLH